MEMAIYSLAVQRSRRVQFFLFIFLGQRGVMCLLCRMVHLMTSDSTPLHLPTIFPVRAVSKDPMTCREAHHPGAGVRVERKTDGNQWRLAALGLSLEAARVRLAAAPGCIVGGPVADKGPVECMYRYGHMGDGSHSWRDRSARLSMVGLA
ncbi:hypothetical protein LX32DRAFT_15954 [Colletotrichum zoysiae]|uniref:Uncharacterized protein n=1 Tax=Colletotrichum zoysiae TaxID=1216348 RepID=A0AAD9HD47_9PEZI|nr:hypothetical protein LX32DRAFT_15954 [Colletotrichum zoysiae]